jgi:hypothetical protein
MEKNNNSLLVVLLCLGIAVVLQGVYLAIAVSETLQQRTLTIIYAMIGVFMLLTASCMSEK